MVSLLTGLLGGLLGGSAGTDVGMNASKESEDALTRQVVDHYDNSKELSSQLAPSGVSNVISQDERLQLISPNQMVHGDFVVNPDIGSQSRQSTQVVMNQLANSDNEIVFEYSSNQNSVFLKDIRLEMQIQVFAEVNGDSSYPVTTLIGGQFWWSQFFNQVRIEINGGQSVITDIGALRAIMLGMEALNPNDGIDVGAVRRHIDASTVNGADYWESIDLEQPNSSTPALARPTTYQGKTFSRTVYLPLTFFDIKELLAPNTILKITFVRNNAPVALIASCGQGSFGGVYLDAKTTFADARIWQVKLVNLSQWLTVFECNPAKMRADALAHTLSGTPNQLVWYLPQHLNFPMKGGAQKDWGTYAVPDQGPYASYTEDLVIQGTGVAPNNYVIVPEVTWQIWHVENVANMLEVVNTNLTWTEAVPGLVTLEKVSINSVDINYPSSILPSEILTALAGGSFEAYCKLAKYRARSATTERFSQKQLNAGTWKRFMMQIEKSFSAHLGNFPPVLLIHATEEEAAVERLRANQMSEVYAQIPWEKLRKMPYTIVNTVLNEDPYVIVTPQRGTVRITVRVMQNFFRFANQPLPGSAVACIGNGLPDNPFTNSPYLPYLGEKQLILVADPQGGALSRVIVLRNPSLNLRVVSLNITMTEYGEYGMTVTNTNLFEKIGAVGGV
jgi:hypothetical protein